MILKCISLFAFLPSNVSSHLILLLFVLDMQRWPASVGVSGASPPEEDQDPCPG